MRSVSFYKFTISGHPFCDKLISLNNPTMPCRYLRASNSKLQQAILWIFIVLVTRNEVRVRTCDFLKWNQLGLSDEYLIVCPFKSFNLSCELRKKHPFTSYFKVQQGTFFDPSPWPYGLMGISPGIPGCISKHPQVDGAQPSIVGGHGNGGG